MPNENEVLARDANSTSSPPILPLPYARAESTGPSAFANILRSLGVCVAILIGISLLDLASRVPGEFYLLGDIWFDRVGYIAVAAGVVIGAVCLCTRGWQFKRLAAVILLEAIAWVALISNLLSQT